MLRCSDIAINVFSSAMGSMVFADLDDAGDRAIRRRASASGRMEEEARRALTAAVGLEREAAAQRLAEVRRRVGPLPGPSSLDDLRRDRTRDEA